MDARDSDWMLAAADLFKITMGSGWASSEDSTAAATASAAAFQASFAANGNAGGSVWFELRSREKDRAYCN